MHYTASKSRTGGRIYLKHSTKKDSVTKEGEGNLGNELRARGGISHKWFVKKTYAGRKHSFFQRVNILWSIWCLVKGLIDVYVSSILHCLWCLFCLLKKHWFFHLTQILWELHFNVLFSKVVEECVNFVSVCCNKCIMKLLLSQQRCIIFSIALHRSVNRSVLVAYKGHLCVKTIEHHWTQGSLWDSKNFTRSNNFVSYIFAVGYLTPFS